MKVNFKATFWQFLWPFLGINILGIITWGLFYLYLPYWLIKFVVNNIEIEKN